MKSIINEILNYFSYSELHETHKGELQSIGDCINHLEKVGATTHLKTLLAIVKKFENEGILLKIGQNGTDPIYAATYIAQNLSPDYLTYG